MNNKQNSDNGIIEGIDVYHQNLTDFLISKGFLDKLLKMKSITQIEYDKCLKDLEKIYLSN